MNNMQGMMKKVQKMQREMAEAQEQLEASTFTGSASNGLVEITMRGDKRVEAVTINPDILDPEDVEMIEDLVMLAVNDATEQVEAETEKSMGQYTQGLNIPGF